MNWRPAGIRVWRSLDSAHASVLIVTVSVQGLVVAAQFLTAVFVEPEVFGQIRWLEAAFAIALLAASCGMPSITFRLAALAEYRYDRVRLVTEAVVLTAFASVFLILLGFVVWIIGAVSLPKWAEPALLFMAFALIPANAARICVAVVQGAQLSRMVALRLIALSGVSVVVLVIGTFMAGMTAWVILRGAVEIAIFLLIWKSLDAGISAARTWSASTATRLYKLFSSGIGANYAFLARILADNLPLLLLPLAGAHSNEVGYYGLANLLLFGPLLLMATTMQARLPALIQAIHDDETFRVLSKESYRKLTRQALACSGVMLIVSGALHLGWGSLKYNEAAAPLALLCVGLPARALILVAGAVAVAHGWFARSSLLALTEIVIVVAACGLGIANNAHEMAVVVTSALWAAVLPAFLISVSVRGACR